jgi:hypothetical protein
MGDYCRRRADQSARHERRGGEPHGVLRAITVTSACRQQARYVRHRRAPWRDP